MSILQEGYVHPLVGWSVKSGLVYDHFSDSLFGFVEFSCIGHVFVVGRSKFHSLLTNVINRSHERIVYYLKTTGTQCTIPPMHEFASDVQETRPFSEPFGKPVIARF